MRRRGQTPWLIVGGAFCLLGVAYLLAMLVRQPLESMDFRYVWLAGDLWGRGVNPYGPDYITEGATRFPTGYAIASWAYPFHWYLPARVAALLPPEPAFAVWLALTTLALAGAGWLVVAAARALGATPGLPAILFAIGYVASGSVVGYDLRAGQPAVIAECGVAMLLYGVARERSGWAIAGLVLAMLKPQIGLPFATALCFMPGGIRAAAVAGALTIAACVPAFLASGLADQLHGLLVVSQGNYQTVSYNTAAKMTGLPHLVDVMTPWTLSIMASMLLAAALTAVSTLLLRGRPPRERRVSFIGLTCATTAFIVGLHTYDLVIVLFTLPLLGTLRRDARLAALAGFALLWRPEQPVFAVTGSLALIPLVQTIALLLILLAWIATVWRSRPTPPATP